MYVLHSSLHAPRLQIQNVLVTPNFIFIGAAKFGKMLRQRREKTIILEVYLKFRNKTEEIWGGLEEISSTKFWEFYRNFVETAEILKIMLGNFG